MYLNTNDIDVGDQKKRLSDCGLQPIIPIHLHSFAHGKLKIVGNQESLVGSFSQNSSRYYLKKLESEIESIEQRIREIDELMLDSKVYTDGPRVRSLQSERAKLKHDIEPLEFEWSARIDDA